MAVATTAGTNTLATLSARPWMGARERCAWATISTMRANTVSSPTLAARMTKPPVWLTVPPVTASPTFFSWGIGSPVIMDSSRVERPSTISPSTGTFSPGRTRNLSPVFSSSSDTSSSSPASLIRFAVGGARSNKDLSACEVCPRARASITWPSRTRVMMTAATSK